MSYQLEGTYYETCTCEVVCPCSATNNVHPADYERCIVSLGFGITSGSVDGVDVSGCKAALILDSPQLMTEFGYRVGVFVDAETDEQKEKLVAVFKGEHGGPPAAGWGPLTEELLGVEFVPIEVYDDGFTHGMRVGDAIDVEIEEYSGIDPNAPMTLSNAKHPASTSPTIAQAKRGKTRAFGIDIDTAGKNGHAAHFSWKA